MTDVIVWGIKRRCILTESEALRKGQAAELKRNIETFKKDIEYLEGQIANPKARIKKDADSLEKRAEGFIKGKKHLKDFITITAEDSRITYMIDREAQEQTERKWFGKKLTITDHLDWEEDDSFKGYVNGIEYKLVSGDYLNFKPELILK